MVIVPQPVARCDVIPDNLIDDIRWGGLGDELEVKQITQQPRVRVPDTRHDGQLLKINQKIILVRLDGRVLEMLERNPLEFIHIRHHTVRVFRYITMNTMLS
jgi:hypothetical protein